MAGVYDRLHHAQNGCLLIARQLRHGFERFFGAAYRPSRLQWLRQLGSKKGGDGHGEDRGELLQFSDRQGDIAPFPLRITLLTDAELLGDLGLGKAGLLAQRANPRPEGAAVGFGRTAYRHIHITTGITAIERNYTVVSFCQLATAQAGLKSACQTIKLMLLPS